MASFGFSTLRRGAFQIRKRGPLFGQPAVTAGAAANPGLRSLGAALRDSLRARARRDRGTFARSIKYKVSGRGKAKVLTVFADAPHARFVESGRGPGKAPGSDRILPWAKRHGLAKFAFVISCKIGERGVKGQHLFRDLSRDEAPLIRKHLKIIQKDIVRALNG